MSKSQSSLRTFPNSSIPFTESPAKPIIHQCEHRENFYSGVSACPIKIHIPLLDRIIRRGRVRIEFLAPPVPIINREFSGRRGPVTVHANRIASATNSRALHARTRRTANETERDQLPRVAPVSPFPFSPLPNLSLSTPPILYPDLCSVSFSHRRAICLRESGPGYAPRIKSCLRVK